VICYLWAKLLGLIEFSSGVGHDPAAQLGASCPWRPSTVSASRANADCDPLMAIRTANNSARTPRRCLRFFVASAHVRDLSVRAKDLLERAKLLLWGANRIGDRGRTAPAHPLPLAVAAGIVASHELVAQS
jgi:hypothetical protein